MGLVFLRLAQGDLDPNQPLKWSGGFADESERTEDQLSVLHCTETLNKQIGSQTTISLDDLVAFEIDGRPSHKAKGAIVFAKDVIGFIDKVIGTEALVTTVYADEVYEKGRVNVGRLGANTATETEITLNTVMPTNEYYVFLQVWTKDGMGNVVTTVGDKTTTSFKVDYRNITAFEESEVVIDYMVVPK